MAYVARLRARWAALEPRIDPEHWAKTATYLAIQEREARWWRDASLAYWMSINGLALPRGVAPPAHDLAWYERQRAIFAPGDS